MDPLVSTLVLILLALLGARFSFSTREVPQGPQLMLRTGIHFLALGFLLGPAALGLLSTEALARFSPVLGLALGWVGLLFGLQLDRTTLQRFPTSFLMLTLGQAVATFAVCFAVAYGAATVLGLRGPAVLLLVLGAAATASVSTPAAVAMVAGNFRARGRVRELLFFVASLDGVVGLLALEVAYAALHGTSLLPVEGPAQAWFWLLTAVGLSVVCAVLFLWLARLRPSRDELVLYLLGLSALAGGAALQLQLSPLFVGMATGGLISNLSPSWDRVFRALERWEKPIYVMLLLLAGATLRFGTWWVVPMALAYTLVRAAAKVLSTGVLVSVLPFSFDAPRRMGLGLISQGGLAIAMAFSLALMLASTGPTVRGIPAGELLFATVVLGVVLSEVLAPVLTAQVLRAAGDIPDAPVPPEVASAGAAQEPGPGVS